MTPEDKALTEQARKNIYTHPDPCCHTVQNYVAEVLRLDRESRKQAVTHEEIIAEMAETLREARDARNPPLLSKIDALLAKLQPPAEPDRAEVLRCALLDAVEGK